VLTSLQRQELVRLLEEAQARGLVGPGAVERHVEHSLAFAEVVGRPPPASALDLGSGAGLPGLVLALATPESEWVLLDGRERSAEFLTTAVERLGLAERARVVGERAEVAAHSELRFRMPLVVARGVGPPAATAELGAGFLAPGGRLVVSEPPDADAARWPREGLGLLGLGPAARLEAGGFHFAALRREGPVPDGIPRRTGRPAKRPLF
jgi:16S rRNA G527 N7-methylase RsmG